VAFSFEFLGTGTSMGVPYIGCTCAVCTSADVRNQRLRCAGLVRCGETTVVIDTGPDFRQQMLRAHVQNVDAFVITHPHSDHIVGLDDVRRFNQIQQRVIDCWADAATLKRLRHCFDWVFADIMRPGFPNLRPRQVELGQPFDVGCLVFEPLDLDHHVLRTMGVLITEKGCCAPALAYCIDVKRMSDATVARLHGVEVLVLDMLRESPHPTHLCLDEALALVQRIGPQKTYFSHMAHEVEHATTEAKLPGEIRLAYDGLRLDL